MNKVGLSIAGMMLVLGMGLAMWTHHLMQERLSEERRSMMSARNSELYQASMKSEVEVARLSTHLAGARAGDWVEADEMALALDVVYSRHFLHSRGAIYRDLQSQDEYSTAVHQIGRQLDQLEASMDAQDWDAAWIAQGEIAVAMNEVTRLSLRAERNIKEAAARELERFRQQCQTLNLLAWLMMVGGCLILGVGRTGRVRTSHENDYELV